MLSSYLEVKMQSTDILKKDRCLWPDIWKACIGSLKEVQKESLYPEQAHYPWNIAKLLLPYPENMSPCLVVGRMPVIRLDVSVSVYSVYGLQKWFPEEVIDDFCTTARKWSNTGSTDDLIPGYTASVVVINLFFNIQANVLENNKMWLTHL